MFKLFDSGEYHRIQRWITRPGKNTKQQQTRTWSLTSGHLNLFDRGEHHRIQHWITRPGNNTKWPQTRTWSLTSGYFNLFDKGKYHRIQQATQRGNTKWLQTRKVTADKDMITYIWPLQTPSWWQWARPSSPPWHSDSVGRQGLWRNCHTPPAHTVTPVSGA